jgi:hypothetical protein
MRFLSQRNTVIAAATLATGGLVFTAMAVSASASSDDLTRSTGTSVVVGAQPSGPSASSPSDYRSHEANEHGPTSPTGSHEANEHGPTSPVGSHEANEHRYGHDGDDTHEDDKSGRQDDHDGHVEESRS